MPTDESTPGRPRGQSRCTAAAWRRGWRTRSGRWHACGPHRRQVQLGRMEDTVGSWWKMAQILELAEKTVRNALKAEP